MTTNNFDRINLRVFAWIFAAISVTSFIAGFNDYPWHFYTAFLSAMVSGILFYTVRKDRDLD